MFKKLSDKFSKGIIYLAAFLVTALGMDKAVDIAVELVKLYAEM